VLLGYSSLYPPDASELALPGPTEGRALLLARKPAVLERLEAVAALIGADARTLDAALLGTARLGLRHGSFGNDFHAYHNEIHVLEVGERRLARMFEGMGTAAPDARDASTLLLFAACHDLRQRERADVSGPVVGNEAASIAEAFRILDAAGFSREADRDQYVALELMIAGSTFDARPTPIDGPRTDQLPEVAGGALARGLALWLDSELPRWRTDPLARRGERLARLAADLDTANVGESFVLLCETALRLCREREMRLGRSLDEASSALPSLEFLGRGQEAYFFELHRFNSREGERVFGAQKLLNGPQVRSTTAALLARFADAPPANGAAVVAAFSELTGAT
jgi:hypothetical protein